MNWTKWSPQHVTNSMDSHSYISENEHSILVTYQTGPCHFQAQKSAHEPVFFPLSLLQKLRSSFQSSCGISPTSKQNLMQPTVLATLLLSKIHHNHNCNCTYLYTTAHHLASTCTTALLPTINDSTHSISLLLAAVVSFHGQSTNHLITPCIYQNINPEFFPNTWSLKHGANL